MKTTIFIFFFFVSLSALAQKNTGTGIRLFNTPAKDTAKQTIPFQVSFFYPLGTNGLSSPRIENNFSFNILYGLNGGVSGAEIGGLVNINKGPVNGFQLGGLTNINAGCTNGAAIGGIANIIGDSSKALLIAGISNVIGNSALGIQVAGISNSVGGSFSGAQIGGISNMATGNVNGCQVAGISNLSGGPMNGLQLAGIANVATGYASGAQIGLVNFAAEMRGLQLGLINISGGDSVIPIGLLSLVKNGYRELEVVTATSVFGSARIKLGVEKFYNIFSVGFTSYKGEQVMSYGFGAGKMLRFDQENGLAFDLHCQRLLPDLWFNWEIDLLNSADVLFRHTFGKHFSVFAGPSLNVYVTQHLQEGEYGSIHVPYTLYSNDWGNGNVSLWIGGSAGAGFRF